MILRFISRETETILSDDLTSDSRLSAQARCAAQGGPGAQDLAVERCAGSGPAFLYNLKAAHRSTERRRRRSKRISFVREPQPQKQNASRTLTQLRLARTHATQTKRNDFPAERSLRKLRLTFSTSDILVIYSIGVVNLT